MSPALPAVPFPVGAYAMGDDLERGLPSQSFFDDRALAFQGFIPVSYTHLDVYKRQL